MKYPNIREEEVKNRVATDWFDKFNCTAIIKDIDFAVKLNRPANAIEFDDEYLLWAEAKKGSDDVCAMLAQLVLTVGKARTFTHLLPPSYLGCFDSEKIAFVPYYSVQHLFFQNDFNWNVTPSNRETKEFQQVYALVEKTLTDIPFQKFQFDFEEDAKELKKFIKENFILGKSETSKIQIDKNNFTFVYQKWHKEVEPTIQFNWEAAKKNNIISGDFFLADLLSNQNTTIKENLFVVLKVTQYEMNRHQDEYGAFSSATVYFNDSQKAHAQFWAKYERPPRQEYWQEIVDRRDLLIEQDIRERKGSFFTPQQWVELSQKYIAEVFGENWQDEYYVWDCCAGTGNLLAGLTNKYNIWASTLDKQDVFVMFDRIKNGANLLEKHVFQFDFLNDSFDKLPENLQKIINDPEKRKKLIMYINPPYAEGDNVRGVGRKNVQVSKIHDKYQNAIGKASGELFAQFFARIYSEILKVRCLQNFQL